MRLHSPVRFAANRLRPSELPNYFQRYEVLKVHGPPLLAKRKRPRCQATTQPRTHTDCIARDPLAGLSLVNVPMSDFNGTTGFPAPVRYLNRPESLRHKNLRLTTSLRNSLIP